MTKEIFQIAIDGPVAAGKSTVAKILAERLDFLYVDTGAMYRAVALKAQQECLQWVDEASIVELLSTLELELDKPNQDEEDGRLVTVLLEGKDISHKIRSPLIGEGASIVSTYKPVREVLVTMQQNIASGESVIMEGRDICSVVLPQAQLKIYMDADPETRAKRKLVYQKDLGIKSDLDQVVKEINQRDEREINREISPLKPTQDAWVLDTTEYSIEEVMEMIIAEYQDRITASRAV
jgi:cytidylate kinase